jgi:DNA-binding NarL/FixJ family response regulator
MNAEVVRVVLVDDHRLVRSGVRAELDSADDGGAVAVVGEAGDVDEAVRVITAEKPDVVLLDVHMPGGGGAEVIRSVHATLPAVRFLALSVSDAAEDVIGVVRAGARGYPGSSSTPSPAAAARRCRPRTTTSTR